MLETNQQITVSMCMKGLGARIVYSVTPLNFSDDKDPIYRFPIRDIGYTVHTSLCYRKDHHITSFEKDFMRLTKAYFETVNTESSLKLHL